MILSFGVRLESLSGLLILTRLSMAAYDFGLECLDLGSLGLWEVFDEFGWMSGLWLSWVAFVVGYRQ